MNLEESIDYLGIAYPDEYNIAYEYLGLDIYESVFLYNINDNLPVNCYKFDSIRINQIILENNSVIYLYQDSSVDGAFHNICANPYVAFHTFKQFKNNTLKNILFTLVYKKRKKYSRPVYWIPHCKNQKCFSRICLI